MRQNFALLVDEIDHGDGVCVLCGQALAERAVVIAAVLFGVGRELSGDLGVDQKERRLAGVPGEVRVGVGPDVGHAADLADDHDLAWSSAQLGSFFAATSCFCTASTCWAFSGVE